MMKSFSLIVFFLYISSCATADLVHPVGGSAYAPTNDSQRPGLVKYLNQGAEFVIKARREDAYKKMFESCDGKYKIVNEGQQADGGSMTPVGNSYMYSQFNYWYISFICEG